MAESDGKRVGGGSAPSHSPRLTPVRTFLDAFSCATAERTVAIFADARMVVLFVLLSIASAIFTVVARTELALTLFLSILALAITSAILFVGESREAIARKRDEAMHAKLDSLLRGVADADDRLAGSERLASSRADTAA